MNKVMLLGRLGQDPEIKATPSGSVCNMNIATSETWVDKSGTKQEKTEWHRVVVWGKLGENCAKYLAKGKQVFLEGKIATRSWESEGVKKYATDIIASNIKFIGGNSDSTSPKPKVQNNVSSLPEYNYADDSLPF